MGIIKEYPVGNLRAGDKVGEDPEEPWYTVVGDARTGPWPEGLRPEDGGPYAVIVPIQYRDGGLGERYFPAENNLPLITDPRGRRFSEARS